MSNTKRAKITPEDLIGSTRLPESTLNFCTRTDLAAEHQRLEAELGALGPFEPSSLADADPRVPLAEELKALEERMAEHTVVLTFRALPVRKYRELLAAHPGNETSERFNSESFPVALIAACLVEPEMSPVDVERWRDTMQTKAWDEVFWAAYMVNEGSAAVPFSESASAILSRRGSK